MEPSNEQPKSTSTAGLQRSDDCGVGYGRPPANTRFKKGQSGNPKGRPKGAANVATILTRTLRERVVINENGRRKTITKLEAAVKQLVNKAASGELRALRHLVELARDAEVKQSVQHQGTQELGELDQEVIEGLLKRFARGQDTEINFHMEADHDDQCR
jgi:Family of unknown function (DUF5681)